MLQYEHSPDITHYLYVTLLLVSHPFSHFIQFVPFSLLLLAFACLLFIILNPCYLPPTHWNAPPLASRILLSMICLVSITFCCGPFQLTINECLSYSK